MGSPSNVGSMPMGSPIRPMRPQQSLAPLARSGLFIRALPQSSFESFFGIRHSRRIPLGGASNVGPKKGINMILILMGPPGVIKIPPGVAQGVLKNPPGPPGAPELKVQPFMYLFKRGV